MLLKPTPTKTEVGASSSASLSKPLPLRFSQITARGFTGAEYRAWVDKIDEVKAYFEPYLTEYNAEPMKIIVNNFVPAIDKLLEYLEESKSSLAIKFRIYNLFKQYFTYGLNNLPVNDVSLEILKKARNCCVELLQRCPVNLTRESDHKNLKDLLQQRLNDIDFRILECDTDLTI